MQPGFIKYFLIFLFCTCFSIKLIQLPDRSFTAKNFAFTYLLTFLTTSFSSRFPMFSHLVPLLVLWVVLSIHISNPKLAFIATTLSFGISYGTHALSSFISTAVIFTISQEKSDYLLKISLLTAPFHAIISLLLLKTKRLKNGLPLAHVGSYINLCTILCLFAVSVPIFFPNLNAPFKDKLLFLCITFFLLAFLIFWWQAQITKTYRHRLLMRELESLRTSEAEKDALIEKLYAENDRLARITHRDNSLITALKDATIKGLCTDFENPKDMIATREKLIANIEKLAEGRSSTSSAYNKRTPREFDTGLSLLDDLLHHMDKEALEQDIMFSVHFGTLLKDFVPENVSESDLTHTVDDLLKNAFKSTRTCESRAVQLQFYKLGKHLVIEVADNGIPFEVRSLVNMGIEQLTTYDDGSGIGLMDIWSTKENYRATYHIDEYATSSPFSKKISLTFDKKNRYTIRTYRKDEILQMSRRADLQVYDDLE